MINIIPAIDIIDGKCVRLTQGDYASKKTYDQDPETLALQYADNGFTHLHIVDLDGAKSGKMVNTETLRKICAGTGIIVDYSGGIRSEQDADLAFSLGAGMISIGSMSYTQPGTVYEWGRKYGFEKIILSADVRDGYILTNGWQHTTEMKIDDFIGSYVSKGFSRFCCTDVSKDGMLTGTNVSLYQQLLDTHSGIQLIASGGVSSIQDIEKLNAIGCAGVIVGKAIYENYISLEQLRKFTRHGSN